MLYTPKSELQSRVSKLQALLEENRLDGALIVQTVDLFYFSGTAQNAHLYVPAQGEPLLMVRKSLNRAKQESALDRMVAATSLKKIPAVLAENGYAIPKTLGLEFDVLPTANYFAYQQVFESSKLVDASGLIKTVRLIKSPYEIELLKVSGSKINEVYKAVPAMLREGMMEVELVSEIERTIRAAGHSGYVNVRGFNQTMFFGVVAAGPTAAIPSAFDGPTCGTGLTPLQPIGAGMNPIRKGDPVLVDIAGLWDSYITDQSRIYSMGPLSAKMVEAFELSLKIQAAIVDRMEPGVNGSDLHQLSLEMAAAGGFADYYMGFGPDQARFVGHGIGLELDEMPVMAKGLNVSIETGMVFALEPKFVFPGEGVVGIENTFALTESGVEAITITPDDLVII